MGAWTKPAERPEACGEPSLFGAKVQALLTNTGSEPAFLDTSNPPTIPPRRLQPGTTYLLLATLSPTLCEWALGRKAARKAGRVGLRLIERDDVRAILWVGIEVSGWAVFC